MDFITRDMGNVSLEHSGGGGDTTTTRPGMGMDPRTWDNQHLVEFLQMNGYQALVEPCRGFTGLQVLSLSVEEMKAMITDSSTLRSFVDLINCFRVLALAASLGLNPLEILNST